MLEVAIDRGAWHSNRCPVDSRSVEENQGSIRSITHSKRIEVSSRASRLVGEVAHSLSLCACSFLDFVTCGHFVLD